MAILPHQRYRDMRDDSRACSEIKVTVGNFKGPLLATSNVTGTGLAGAAKIDAADMPKVPDPILPPAEPYKLH